MADLNDVKLSTQDILKKQFKNKVKGYDPDEVDAYLDQVIADYETFQQIIEDLYGQIGDLQRKLMDNKKKAAESEPVKTYTPTSTRSEFNNTHEIHSSESSTNMAIIQRISSLERKVYHLEQNVYGLQKE